MLKMILRIGTALILLVALCAVGYRRGYRRGYEPEVPTASSNAIIVRTYPVADLVTPIGVAKTSESKPEESKREVTAPDFDELIELIVLTIAHETWMENGTGEGEIQPFPANRSLVVSQTQSVHAQIADLLQQLRRLSTTVEAKDVVPYLQSAAAYGKNTSHAFRVLQGDAQGREAIDNLFAKAVRNLSDFWGSPEFNGACSADGPYAWCSADRLACWPRAGGMAYLAVEYGDESKHQLLAGWHPKEQQ
jgi:hypothetical protein